MRVCLGSLAENEEVAIESVEIYVQWKWCWLAMKVVPYRDFNLLCWFCIIMLAVWFSVVTILFKHSMQTD
jgi:hypothetical protein